MSERCLFLLAIRLTVDKWHLKLAVALKTIPLTASAQRSIKLLVRLRSWTVIFAVGVVSVIRSKKDELFVHSGDAGSAEPVRNRENFQ